MKTQTDKENKHTTYVYDGMGRLTQEREDEGNTISYTYDRFSNRATMTVVSGGKESTTVYEYHPNNWLLKEVKTTSDTEETTYYRYDANGNMVWRQYEKLEDGEVVEGRAGFVTDDFHSDIPTLVTKEYNGFNQMVSMYSDGIRGSYTYRPDGLRYSKSITDRKHYTRTRTHYWDGQNIVAEQSTGGDIVARYLRGINLIACELIYGTGRTSWRSWQPADPENNPRVN